MIIKKLLLTSIFFTAIMASGLIWAVDVNTSDYTGSRSASNGLNATSAWGTSGTSPINLSWNITQTDGIFHYVYNISGPDGADLSKNVSHFLLEVSPTITPDNVGSLIKNPSIPISAGPKTFSPSDPGNSNPGLPGDIYGIKVDITSGNAANVVFDFFSERAPIWGDFYTKDGKSGGLDVYAYNKGFGTDPTDLTTDFTPWVPTPDTNTVAVPEPGTWLILSSILAFVAIMQRRRSKAKL